MPTADLFTMAEHFSVPHCSPMTELSLFTHAQFKFLWLVNCAGLQDLGSSVL